MHSKSESSIRVCFVATSMVLLFNYLFISSFFNSFIHSFELSKHNPEQNMDQWPLYYSTRILVWFENIKSWVRSFPER